METYAILSVFRVPYDRCSVCPERNKTGFHVSIKYPSRCLLSYQAHSSSKNFPTPILANVSPADILGHELPLLTGLQVDTRPKMEQSHFLL